MEAAGKVWNQENVRRAAAAGRAVRDAGQGGWVLSPVLSSVTPGASIVTQVRAQGEQGHRGGDSSLSYYYYLAFYDPISVLIPFMVNCLKD